MLDLKPHSYFVFQNKYYINSVTEKLQVRVLLNFDSFINFSSTIEKWMLFSVYELHKMYTNQENR